jgi:hypothetical protein
MSKSECEALALYQKFFNDYCIYKYRCEWDGKRKVLVEVKSSKNQLSHRLHIPGLLGPLAAVLCLAYVNLYRHCFPKEMEEISFVGQAMQIGCTLIFGLQICVYWFIFIAYLDKLVLGCDRLLSHISNLSKLLEMGN